MFQIEPHFLSPQLASRKETTYNTRPNGRSSIGPLEFTSLGQPADKGSDKAQKESRNSKETNRCALVPPKTPDLRPTCLKILVSETPQHG
ncbi:hypothetical protein SprV_0401660200 [Sparganum proliferum]